MCVVIAMDIPSTEKYSKSVAGDKPYKDCSEQVRLLVRVKNKPDLRVVTAVSNQFFHGLGNLLDNLDLTGSIRIFPEATTGSIDTSLVRCFSLDFVSFVQATETRKKKIDNEELTEFVIRVLQCFLLNADFSYKKLEIDPYEYDPSITVDEENLFECLQGLFWPLKPGKKYIYNDEFECKYEGITIFYRSYEIPTPPATDKFWIKIKPVKKEIAINELRRHAEELDLTLSKVSTNGKNYGYIDGIDCEYEIKFIENCFSNYYKLLDTKVSVIGSLLNKTCYVFEIIDKPKYPYYITINQDKEIKELSLF